MQNCLNCGEALIGEYCYKCGQKKSIQFYSFKAIFNEIFVSFADLDFNLVRTFKAMMTNPGKFVRDYLNGKRVDYISPFKYLIIVLAINIAATFILNKPAMEPVKITGIESILLKNQIVNILTIIVFILFMIPMAAGVKIFNKKAHTYLEYYLFLLYVVSQSIIIFIFLLLALRMFYNSADNSLHGIIWIIVFSFYYMWSYLTFFKNGKTNLAKFFGSYFTGLIILFGIITGAGLIIKSFI